MQSRKDWEAILPTLREAAKSGDRDAERRLALALYGLGRLDDARKIYESLLARSEDPVVRNRLGNVLRDQGDLAGAEKAYRMAIKSEPTQPAPYLNLAELLWRQHRDDEAIALLQQGLRAVKPASRPPVEAALQALRGGAVAATTSTTASTRTTVTTQPGPTE